MKNFDQLINRNKNINRGYRKLEVWQEAVKLFAFIKKKLNSHKTISYKTKAQIEDSIISVPSNISEGYSRRYLKETIQFNSIALSSLSENYTQIFSLLTSRDIAQAWFDEYDKKHYSLENKLINYNGSLIKKLKSRGDWQTDYQISDIISSYEKSRK